MAITPAPGYQVDPSNSNGVIPIGGSTSNYVNPNAGLYGQNVTTPTTAPTSQAINTSGTKIPSADLNSFTQANPGLAFTGEDLTQYNAAGNNPINTTTPSPSQYQGNSIVDALNQSGQASDFASRTALAAQYGITGYTGTADQNTQLLNKYQSALATAKASGKSSPTSQGDASAAISGLTKSTTDQQNQQEQANTDFKNINDQLKADPGYQQLIADHTAYLNSTNQQQTLEQEYTSLSDKLGLPALNTQLINMKAVIDGTEGDIRNEITKAGGFATDSQVMALAAARNKTLTQNYNNLLATRDNAQTQINTMIGLSEKDRALAQQQASDQLNYDEQINSYTQKFTQNAQDALTSMQKSEGWDGIYKAAIASGDPSAIQRINSTMGNGFDLATMAKQDEITRQNDLIKTQQAQAQANATLANTKANTVNTQANTAKTNAETADANGVPNPAKVDAPGYNAQGVKYTTATATTDVKAAIKANGQTGTRNLLAPNDYNYWKSWWVQQGLSDASFDSVFGGMKDPGLAKSNVYN